MATNLMDLQLKLTFHVSSMTMVSRYGLMARHVIRLFVSVLASIRSSTLIATLPLIDKVYIAIVTLGKNEKEEVTYRSIISTGILTFKTRTESIDSSSLLTIAVSFTVKISRKENNRYTWL